MVLECVKPKLEKNFFAPNLRKIAVKWVKNSVF